MKTWWALAVAASVSVAACAGAGADDASTGQDDVTAATIDSTTVSGSQGGFYIGERAADGGLLVRLANRDATACAAPGVTAVTCPVVAIDATALGLDAAAVASLEAALGAGTVVVKGRLALVDDVEGPISLGGTAVTVALVPTLIVEHVFGAP